MHSGIRAADWHKMVAQHLLGTGALIDPSKTYSVAGWASVNEDTQGPQIWDVVENHIRELGTVKVPENNNVQIIGA